MEPVYNEQTSGNPPPSRPLLKTRSACDHCHQQKLRCIKTRMDAGCERCAKLKKECRYSPRERRPARNKPLGMRASYARSGSRRLAASISTADPPEGTRYDWTPGQGGELYNAESLADVGCFGLNYTVCQHFSPDRLLAMGPSQTAQSTESLNQCTPSYGEGELSLSVLDYRGMTYETIGDTSLDSYNHNGLQYYHNTLDTGSEHLPTPIIARLASLNVTLSECASKLPLIKSPGASAPGKVGAPCAVEDTGRRGAVLFALDEVFRAAHEFVEVMNSLSSAVNDRGCAAPLTLAQSREYPNDTLLEFALIDSSEGPEAARSFPRLDEATALLFLSCHCRLAEIYEAIFRAIKHCLRSSYTASSRPLATSAGIILPGLQVGGPRGLSSPALRVEPGGSRLPPATVSMYMMLITTLSSQLWTQVGISLRRVKCGADHSQRRSATVPVEGATDVTWDAAILKTDNMSRTIELIQHML